MPKNRVKTRLNKKLGKTLRHELNINSSEFGVPDPTSEKAMKNVIYSKYNQLFKPSI